MRTIAIALVAAACGVTFAPSFAEARNQTSEEVSYRFEQVWPAAVRYIRIDAGHPIEEKYEQNGYILFVYKDEGREFRGALELVRIRDHEGRDAVRLVLRIDARPSYMERMMLNRLVRKLRDELGPPPPAPPPPAPAPAPAPDDDGDEAAAPVYRRAP